MRAHIIFLIASFFLINDGFAQKEKAQHKKWEVGIEGYQNLVLTCIKDVYYGHNPTPEKEWQRGIHNGTDKNRSGGVYLKYNVLNFFSINAGMIYDRFLLNVGGSRFWLNYKDNHYYEPVWYYYTENIDFPFRLRAGFFNKGCVNPYIFVGISNRICVTEKVLIINSNFLEYYNSKQWKYYAIKGICGAGVDFTIKKQVRIGAEANYSSPPFWQTQKSLVTGIKYTNYSFGVHVGYVL